LNTPLREQHPLAQLFLLLGLCLGLALLGTALLYYLAPAVTGFSLDAIGLQSSIPSALLPLLWLSQGIMQLFIFVVPALIFLYYFDFNQKGNPLTRLRGVPVAVYGLTPLLAAGLLPLAYSLHTWNQSLHLPPALAEWEDAWRASEQQTEHIIKAFLSASGAQALLMNMVILVLLPALGEELIFRGIVQRIFMRWVASPHAAIWICGALFSAIHMQWLGFFPRWLLGVELGYLAWFTGSLWPAVLSHATHNALSIGVAQATGFSEQSNADSDAMGMPGVWVVGGLALAAAAAWMVYKIGRKGTGEQSKIEYNNNLYV
jgi:membrane protease YdiL (CAAX protease family)